MDDERAELLLHKSMYGWVELDPSAELHSPEFVTFCLGHYREMLPLMDWVSGQLS